MGNLRCWESGEVAVWHVQLGQHGKCRENLCFTPSEGPNWGPLREQLQYRLGAWYQQKHKALCTVANQRDGASSLFSNIWPWRASQHSAHQ